MKRWTALFLILVLLAALTACGSDEQDMEQVITMAPEASEESAPETQAPDAQPGAYAFTVEGVTLTPGEPFDAAALGEAQGVYEAPSCAIVGMDIVYQYGSYEVTAVDDGTGEVLYSVYLLDPNLATPEGLSLGDSTDTVRSLYGDNYEQQDSAWVYTAANTQLILVLNNDTVGSIEYRMVP